LTDALFPFIPSLVAWGHDEATIAAVVTAAAGAISPTQITVVYLREDPATALARAVDREGQEWGQWYVDKLARWPGTRHVRDLESAADHLRWETNLTMRVLDRTPCRVITVDVHGRTAPEVERELLARAADLLGDAGAGCGR
jgi:hypothetical protein